MTSSRSDNVLGRAPGVDTGDIDDIDDQEPAWIGPNDTVTSVYTKVDRAGARMLRSLRALTDSAAFWCSRDGVACADPFQVLREVER